MALCYTAIIGDLAFEGHVPIAEVNRVLAATPKGVRGFAVAGISIGSRHGGSGLPSRSIQRHRIWFRQHQSIFEVLIDGNRSADQLIDEARFRKIAQLLLEAISRLVDVNRQACTVPYSVHEIVIEMHRTVNALY